MAGELRIGDVDGGLNDFRRHLRVASLWIAFGGVQRPELRLTSPELLRTVDGALLIRGIETASMEGRVHEFEEMWLVAIHALGSLRDAGPAIPAATDRGARTL